MQCSVPCGSADIADSCPAAASDCGVKAVYTARLSALDALLVPVEPAAASAETAERMFCSAGSSEPADLQYAAALH